MQLLPEWSLKQTMQVDFLHSLHLNLAFDTSNIPFVFLQKGHFPVKLKLLFGNYEFSQVLLGWAKDLHIEHRAWPQQL